MRTLMGRLMGGAHDRGADEAGAHEGSRPRASWPSRLFRPEGALYRSPGQRPGSHGPTTPFPEPSRGDLGFRVANMGLDVSIVVRPFRALWFAWRPVPRALPWAAMGRTFGARDGAVDGGGACDRGADEAGAHDAETWRSGVSAGSETRAERGRTEIFWRSKDDNSPTNANRTATFGDHRRQKLGLRMGRAERFGRDGFRRRFQGIRWNDQL